MKGITEENHVTVSSQLMKLQMQVIKLGNDISDIGFKIPSFLIDEYWSKYSMVSGEFDACYITYFNNKQRWETA